MKRKNNDKKKSRSIMNGNAVTIEYFVRYILGINNEELLKMGLTHKDLTTLMKEKNLNLPVFKRTSFDDVLLNEEDVVNGTIVVVTDSNGQNLPYRVSRELRYESPSLVVEKFYIESLTYEDESVTWEQEQEEIIPISDYDLESMATYELAELSRYYKSIHKLGWAEKINREIKRRPDSKSSVRKNKEKSKRKEMKNNRYYY